MILTLTLLIAIYTFSTAYVLLYDDSIHKYILYLSIMLFVDSDFSH